MKMYVISWLGNNEAIKQKRFEAHTKQVDWAISLGIEPVVLNQEYAETHYDSRVKYVGDNTKHSPAEARNILLKEFYASDDDWAIFADNDAKFRFLTDFDFMKEFQESTFESVDLFTPINPIILPFNKKYQENKAEMDSHFCFEQSNFFKGSLFFIKNIRKHYGEEMMFDEWFGFDSDGRLISREDEEFALHMKKRGYKTYVCMNLVLVEICSTPSSSTWANEGGSRFSHKEMTDAYTNKKHGIVINDSDDKEYICVFLKDGKIHFTNDVREAIIHKYPMQILDQPIPIKNMVEQLDERFLEAYKSRDRKVMRMFSKTKGFKDHPKSYTQARKHET